MRTIVPFQVSVVTPAAPARLKAVLTVVSGRSISAVLDGVATASATAVEQKEASR